MPSDWGVIFDWDGVLVDSARQHEASWERLANEAGLPLPPGHFQRSFGMKNEWIIPMLLRWTQDPAEIRRLSQRKEWWYRRLVADEGLELCRGAAELLAALTREGVSCAVGSSTPRENLTFILDRLGLAGAFQATVTAEDVQRGKPDPDVFVLAAARLGLPPARGVVVEDAPVGIAAAHAAGMRVVGVTTTHPEGVLRGADEIIPGLNALTVARLRMLVDTGSP